MDGSALNVAAPVFQPSGAAASFVPASRHPSSLQTLGSSSASDAPPQAQDPSIRPTLLSQIQNQMTAGGGNPGGMVQMNANSRPFIPGGGAKNSFFELETPTTPYQPGPMPFPNTARSPLPSHSMGHAMNPGSVQLTGLPAFLATPPIMNHMPHMPLSPGFAGPPSPLSPNLSGAVSPFIMPPGQVSLGLPHPATLMNGHMKFRKAKGLPPVTPLKTTGHNSTPSISMNPAAFAANLAALKTKRKVIVCLPAEQPLPTDEKLLASPEDGPLEGAARSDADKIQARRARAAASTRSKWLQRTPWSLDQHVDSPCVEVPKDAIVTCDIHPEPWPYSLGLPDTIDIYLPGLSAWDEYLDMRYEEQQMEVEAADHNAQSPFVHEGLSLPPNTAAFHFDHKGRSLSISTPADPSMVTFKLNRFLQSQGYPHEGSKQLFSQEPATKSDDAEKPFGRFQSDLPHRLREAFARRRGESMDLSLRSTPKHAHTHTMSLGLPSSGGPFGAEVFSALDMIRANSDEGPSKPPSEAQDLPDKPLSDTEAFVGRSEIYLSNITEEEAEREEEAVPVVEGHTRVGSWKDLGRGFGYEHEAQRAAQNGSSGRHARQASRISVTTSRHDGEENEELDFDAEEAEIRTNPSEDADASDFEEENEEFGPEHWRAQQGSVHLSAFGDPHGRYGDEGVSHASDDDSLQDSLTPSDEQFSNPSDEEAAREERMLRRQHRAAERAARRERQRRRRGRANTDNTLPSSSIGEADLHKIGRYGHNEQQQRTQHGEIISNPSDEEQSDVDDSRTFGYNDRSSLADPGPRFSRDFRFPPPQPSLSDIRSHAADNRPPMSGTLGRASGLSLLNPDAKEFKFGGASASARTVSAPISGEQDVSEAAKGHFRLPSIKTSSFGSALGDVAANVAHLNVCAAPFTPGTFTFKAGQRLQVPETSRSASPRIAISDIDGDADHRQAENREMQGREKRTRYGPIDYDSQDERDPEYSTSPPRPRASAASIEGPLRNFSSLSRNGPPPFLPAGYAQQQRAVSHESRLAADAPSFVPTWAKGSQPFGGSTSFKRPSLPDWNQQAQQDLVNKALPTILDPAFFAREARSKAIPIRKPAEAEKDDASPQSHSALPLLSVVPTPTSPGAIIAAGSLHATANDAGQTSTETIQAPAVPQGSEYNKTKAERAQPVQIPGAARSYHSPAASMASESGVGPSIRWDERRAPSRVSMSSLDWRLRRSDRGRNGAHSSRENYDDDFEDDEESITDVVEEIVDRLDKALEGWAGKILDEVTIMGQVRPHPRNSAATADFSIDQDKIVEEMSKRIEQALDSRLTSTFFATHTRKLTGASDETQSTIRPIRQKSSFSDVKTASSSVVDTPGEWDFDYVQDILDVKLGEFRSHIEATLAQVMDKLEKADQLEFGFKQIGDGEGVNRSDLPSDFAETVTMRLMTQLESALELHFSSATEVRTASDANLQTVLQSKLDENLFLLSEKGAADRSSIQQMLEAELHELEQSIGKVGSSVQEHVRSALMVYLPPLLEDKASSDASLADRLTNQLGQALGPVLSEERRSMLEEHQRSRDLLMESMPSSSQIAQSTVKLVEPLVKSLKSDPVDSDALVSRLAEVIGKQSIEHLVDLNPVLALLEPLIVKHEEARAFSKKILQRQEDTERTLSELPGAINAKTEIFLSSATTTSEKQGIILEQIAQIKAELRRSAAASSDAASTSADALQKRLEDLAKDKQLTRETAEKTLSELAGVYQVLDSSYEALSRLEAQHTSSEEAHQKLITRLEKQAEASSDSARELRDAEARAARAEAGQAEAVAKLTSANKESAALREQLASMAAEITTTKAEKIQEREASAKAVAEAMARADRAEAANAETQDRMGRLLEQATVGEREAYDSAKAVLERAAKAEGQVAALEKRIAEQDNKIANLQQLSATQKQKAAQSHQKLAEGEKRVKELEGRAGQLAEAEEKLVVLEQKTAELEEARQELRESREREAHIQGQLEQYDERFQQMERELVAMKEQFVERVKHEQVQTQLKESQRLVEELQAKLQAATSASLMQDGWEAVEKPSTGAWASMHAPRIQIEDHAFGSAATPMRSVSFASTTTSHGKREVEVDEGGWWS